MSREYHRTSPAIDIYVDDAHVVLVVDTVDEAGVETTTLRLPPECVDLLCRWLDEARQACQQDG